MLEVEPAIVMCMEVAAGVGLRNLQVADGTNAVLLAIFQAEMTTRIDKFKATLELEGTLQQAGGASDMSSKVVWNCRSKQVWQMEWPHISGRTRVNWLHISHVSWTPWCRKS